MGWRREIVGTWGWPVVSFRGGPLQTQNHGQKSGPADTVLSVSATPSFLVKVPGLSLVHPSANHCRQGKGSVFTGLSWHKWGSPSPDSITCRNHDRQGCSRG